MKTDGDDRQGRPDGAAGDLQRDQQQGGAHENLEPAGVADPLRHQFGRQEWQIERGTHGQDGEDDVEDIDAVEGVPGVRHRSVVGRTPPGKQQEPQTQHEGQVDPEVQQFTDQREARGVEVIDRHRHERRKYEPAHDWPGIAIGGFGVELPFDRGQFVRCQGSVGVGCGHGAALRWVGGRPADQG